MKRQKENCQNDGTVPFLYMVLRQSLKKKVSVIIGCLLFLGVQK
ncbi:hypothetical protein HMPREF1981_02717 [Bacteroides pyogenes F0041]|uniref:Uncharacterized protein n=1 Tax=Bacteroides pyogenes F0041 TaxID=1321819 RepID=U2DKG8_9BACE|nr:hypothetical protein HMPREF1981_02717 [Bacteroides pyogenes F0041]